MTTWQSPCLAAIAIFLLSGVAPSQTANLEAQKAVVVKLQVHFAKQGDETAAGLFVGKDQQYAYFITARHALVDDTGAQPVAAKSVKLQFSNGPQSFNASIFGQTDPTLDLGVVYLPLANLPPNLPEIVKMDAVADTPILIIGHPAAGDWSVWHGTVQNENAPNDVRRFITSTNPSLAKGYSGGPEFDQSGSFVGMQVETEVTYGIAAKGADVVAQLKGWRIPTNNLIAKPIIVAPPPESQQPDIDSIKSVLSRYEDAFNHTDAKALWKIWPNPPADTKQKIEVYFKNAASIRASLHQNTPEFAANHVEATVAAKFSQRFTPRQGNQQPTHDDDYVFKLRKNAGEWIIVEVK